MSKKHKVSPAVSSDDAGQYPRDPLPLLLHYLDGNWSTLSIALALALINQIFLMVDPLILRRVLDKYVVQGSHGSTWNFLLSVGPWLILILAAALIAWTAKGFQTSRVCQFAQRVSNSIYADGISHTLDLPYAEYERRQSGDTIDRLQQMRREVELFLTAAVNTLFTSLVGLIFVLIYASRIHWSIVPFLLVAAPALMGFSVLLSRKVRTVQEQIVEESAALAGSTTESLRNIELVKSLGLTGHEVARFRSISDRILGLELRKIKLARIYSFFHGAGVHLLRICLFLLLLYLLSTREITVGEFFSLFLYFYFILGPMQDFGAIIGQYRELEASLRGFRSLVDHPREVTRAQPGSLPSDASSPLGTLAFDDVAFAYSSSLSPAVAGISLQVRRGETIAFVGPSGAGKSTLVKLISGLYLPSQGHILFDGVSGSESGWNDIRGRISLVTQETQLFAGTIRHNLLFVSPNATEQECLLAMHRASLQPMLRRASLGLDTVIGEGGLRLSGGEKQRLSIARALLRRPELLIFDEATSALDSLTEQEIAEMIRSIAASHNAITIVITHRLATVVNADRIYVLDGGRIVGSGSHDALLAEGGLYGSMWLRQAGLYDPS